MLVSEVWVREDGSTVTVDQRQPLICDRVPMTVDTLASETITYPLLVSALRAYGYGLQNPVDAAADVAATAAAELEHELWEQSPEGYAFATAYDTAAYDAAIEQGNVNEGLAS
jgi:hypothetical protein